MSEQEELSTAGCLVEIVSWLVCVVVATWVIILVAHTAVSQCLLASDAYGVNVEFKVAQYGCGVETDAGWVELRTWLEAEEGEE